MLALQERAQACRMRHVQWLCWNPFLLTAIPWQANAVAHHGFSDVVS